MNLNIIDSISETYGSPTYVFDIEAFTENYNKFLKSMASSYANYRIAYSYKTNHAPAICKLVKNLGAYAEVVSDMEYYIAKKLEYSNNKIIYNGPFKGSLAEEHLLAGGIINIDSLDELNKLIDFALNYPNKTFSVGIRVNVEIGQNFISRFGIDAESDDLATSVERLKEAGNIRLAGFHFHVGKARGIEAWRNRSKKLIELCDKYIGIPEYVDLGSGMFGDIEESLAAQFPARIPTYDEYADATARVFAERYGHLPEEQQPILFTEPGTTLINRYVRFIAKVDSIKTIKGKEFAVLNCSKYNLGEMCASKKLPLQVVHLGGCARECKNLDMSGYTCLENDVVYRGYTGKLAVGDYVIFGNIGGYSNVAKPPFILPNCPMVTLHKDGSTSLIKRKEEYSDVFATYVW